MRMRKNSRSGFLITIIWKTCICSEK
ncbi:hypothetical protein B4U79_03275 [Dinothrombium tinctorium]|uniref:Uncharacterized protein n=1 Tax=Dinothrombium tinctorium TaxID=1965070 RepID=A0A3S3N9M0_9ACAR|nr:hypothetical protein B4U79_03275 [Dinothrombium tinctorium]